jgi:hypothetical protein
MEVEPETRIVLRPHPDQHGPYISGGWRDLNAITVVGKKGVGHKQRAGGAGSDIYSVCGKPKNIAIFNVQGGARKIPDSIQTASSGPLDAVDTQVSQYDDVGRTSLDNNAVGARHQDTGHLPAAAVNCDTLRYGNSAVSGGI